MRCIIWCLLSRRHARRSGAVVLLTVLALTLAPGAQTADDEGRFTFAPT
jgi:hypothetical protein